MSEWLTEHIVEILSLIATIMGFFVGIKYLIKIEKNQRVTMSHSPNSQQITVMGNITNSQISHFKEELKKETAISEATPEKEDNPKKLVNKIESYLDEGKPVSVIAQMSLRLAKELEMKEDEKWLRKEVEGYKEYLNNENKNGMQIKNKGKESQHRRLEAELNLGFNNGKVETFKIPMFISQSLSQIETWAKLYSKHQQIVLKAQPLNIMVETLHVDPNEEVPYLVNPQQFKKILDETKMKIIDFLDRAKNNVKQL